MTKQDGDHFAVASFDVESKATFRAIVSEKTGKPGSYSLCLSSHFGNRGNGSSDDVNEARESTTGSLSAVFPVAYLGAIVGTPAKAAKSDGVAIILVSRRGKEEKVLRLRPGTTGQLGDDLSKGSLHIEVLPSKTPGKTGDFEIFRIEKGGAERHRVEQFSLGVNERHPLKAPLAEFAVLLDRVEGDWRAEANDRTSGYRGAGTCCVKCGTERTCGCSVEDFCGACCSGACCGTP